MYGTGSSLFYAADGWHDDGSTTDEFWGPSVHWNSYLQMYVMLLNRAKNTRYDQEGIYVSFAPRLVKRRIGQPRLRVGEPDSGRGRPRRRTGRAARLKIR